MSPARVELWLMRILSGLPVWVSTMKGSKLVTPALIVLIVLAALLVPHQLLVAVTVVLLLFRLLPPPPVVFPARRLKLMVSGPAEGKALAFPVEMPPPLPVAEFPVMVTWLRVAEQVCPGGQLAGAKLLR